MEQSKLQTTVPAKLPYPWRVPIIYTLLGGPLGAWLLACYYLWLQSGWLAQAGLAEVFGAMWGLVLWAMCLAASPRCLPAYYLCDYTCAARQKVWPAW